MDLVTSRQLIDQQAVETRVRQLIERQNQIGVMQEQAQKVMQRAGVRPTIIKNPPKKKFSKTGLRLGALVGSSSPFTKTVSVDQRFDIALGGTELFDSMEATLEETEKAQLSELARLKKSADHKASKLASILGKQGIRLPNDTGVGGPPH